ncbi:T-cell-specific surface glycoprotein CD28-like [Triplophysa dalaica]|uniref:T-cell-specific surface glycoprotein CD28-like n=1 Tax=Triplophysa dalaica TaxID=1582913 RepID=UPI0024E0169B|nr:T-cell-specific surface glycoprotein CD28-like [Triplophysa dalaica]
MIIILVTIILYIQLGLALHVSQPYRVEGKAEYVPLHCLFHSKLRPEEMQVSLYKGLHGQERICSAYVNLSEPFFTTSGSVQCRGNISSGRVDMIIYGLKGEDTDIYRCVVEILYPPPYLSKVGNGTVVYIQDTPNCSTAFTEGQSHRQTSEWSSMSIDAGPLLLLYAILIITSCILILQIMKIVWKRRDTGPMALMASQKDSYSKF